MKKIKMFFSNLFNCFVENVVDSFTSLFNCSYKNVLKLFLLERDGNFTKYDFIAFKLFFVIFSVICLNAFFGIFFMLINKKEFYYSYLLGLSLYLLVTTFLLGETMVIYMLVLSIFYVVLITYKYSEIGISEILSSVFKNNNKVGNTA